MKLIDLQTVFNSNDKLSVYSVDNAHLENTSIDKLENSIYKDYEIKVMTVMAYYLIVVIEYYYNK